MRLPFRSNTYANVTATAALVLALTGTGYAAGSLHHSASKAGGLPTVLGHGKTETGAWGGSQQPASDDIQTDSISFPIHLKSAPTLVVRQDGSSSSHCPGNASKPKAKPGFLCVYVASGSNHGDVSAYKDQNGHDGADKFGAIVYWTPVTSGDFTYAAGTWAVTAK
jgi:hypothetical protein